MTDKIYNLLGAVQALAPDDIVQQRCARIVNRMICEGENEQAICLALGSILVDGLRHGNWPQ